MSIRIITFGFVLLSAISLSAQIKVDGEVSAQGGVGYANPWASSTRLNISTPKLKISPFFGIKGTNNDCSAMDEEAEYIYTGKLPLSTSKDYLYTSKKSTQAHGMDMEYGATFSYQISQVDLLTASIKGDYDHRHLHGLQEEVVYLPLDNPLSANVTRFPHSVVGSEWNNKSNEQNLDVSAGYTHIFLDMPTWLMGSKLDVQYNYVRESEDIDQMQKILPTYTSYTRADNYDLVADGLTQKHRIQADFQIPLLFPSVPLNVGAFYENRQIRSNDAQWLATVQVMDDHFKHDYKTIGAYLKGKVSLGPVNLNAKLEYNFTQIDTLGVQMGKNLHDFVPEFGASWQMSKGNTLVFNYVRRIVRPSLTYLNPAEVYGPYTMRYGNPEIVCMHANSFILKYILKHDKIDFTTTFQHIAANDGFNGIWMERELMRIYTWGNEGKRRAWSMTPEMVWRPCKQTSIQTKATIIWDKREAEAINMAKEHWGITTSARITQQLPLDIRMQIYCDYSEGNTIDLYSHQGRQLGYGAELQRKLTNNGKLVAAIGYDHKDDPKVILTQGPYTGSLYEHLQNEDSGWLRLTYKF